MVSAAGPDAAADATSTGTFSSIVNTDPPSRCLREPVVWTPTSGLSEGRRRPFYGDIHFANPSL